METQTRTPRPIATVSAAVTMATIGGIIVFFGIGLLFQHLYPVGIPEGVMLSWYRGMPVLVILVGAVLLELAVSVYVMGRGPAKAA